MGAIAIVACYEVEHQGDLDAAESDIVSCGAKVVKRIYREAEEEAFFRVDLGDMTRVEFKRRLDERQSMCELV